MDNFLRFYNYEGCYEYYSNQILNIRQAKIRGEVIVAKPVLLLSLIDGIGEGVYKGNCFQLDEWLEKRYLALMTRYTKDSQFDLPASIDNPFWHLESDGFWHLQTNEERSGKSRTPSKLWLKEHVEFAWFDDDLWILLQHREWREKLRELIVQNKLTK